MIINYIYNRQNVQFQMFQIWGLIDMRREFPNSRMNFFIGENFWEISTTCSFWLCRSSVKKFVPVSKTFFFSSVNKVSKSPVTHFQTQLQDGSRVLCFLEPSLIFPFHLSPSPVHLTEFSFYIFLGFLAIFPMLSSNSNNII